MAKAVYHVTLPIVTYAIMRVEHDDNAADTDELAQAAYQAWKRGDDAVCHLAPQAEWDNASVELVEDNSPSEPEYEPDDDRERAEWARMGFDDKV